MTVKDEYYTIAEAEALLRRDRRNLHRWRKARKGPPWVKIGYNVLYPKTALEGWMIERALEECPFLPRPDAGEDV